MAPVLPQRPMGKQGFKTSAQGLGCMGMSFGYAQHNAVSEQDFHAVLQRAGELGITLLDTAEAYGPDRNEELVGRGIKGGHFQIATKFGVRPPAMVPKGSPEYVRGAVEGSLKRLGIDCIDLYYQHRVDRTLPIEETWQELKGARCCLQKLVEEGKVKYLGISEASPAEVRKAHAVHPITACQLEWSLWSRDAEASLVKTCRELGIAIVAYSPLGRGFLTGQIKSPQDLPKGDSRSNMPRFAQENFEKNMELVEVVKAVADKLGATPGQVALAWVHQQGDDVFPIPGTRRIKYLEENVEAFSLKLAPEDMKTLDRISADVVGERYGEAAATGTWDKGLQG